MFYGWYIVIAGTVVSPPIAGWVYDSLGTYGPIWLILGGLALVWRKYYVYPSIPCYGFRDYRR